MNYSQQNRPLSLNLDKSPHNLGETEAYFILNQDRFLGGDGSKRGSLGKTSPLIANKPACELELPGGENYTDGTYYCNLTNETYDWKFNSNGVHCISRINGDGECQIVYHGGCLSLNALPRHSIEQWRAYLKVDKICANQHGKQLIWVNGISEIGMIDVEASIATDFFTTPFFQRCADPCAYIQMCVPDPCGCLKGEFVPYSNADAGKSNNLLDIPIQLSYRHIYYDGRASIWAEPSTTFYQDTRGCFDTSEGFPRCLKIRVPIGNPLVDKIEIAFSKDGATWYQTDTVDKYKKYNSTQQYWYERDLAELTNYSDIDCSFDYFFCNDKQCNPIAPEEFNRVFNPMPREPQGFFPIGLSNQEDIALAFYNYIQGSCPIDKFQIDKFDIQTSCPENSCNVEYTKITAYAVVHNREKDRNQPIFRLGGDAANSPDDPADIAYFGGLNNVGAGSLELGHGQQFTGDIRNFIAYIDGTGYWDEAKQWKADPGFVAKEEWGTLGHFTDNSEKNRWRRAIRDGQYFYQKFEFTVPRGTRGFLRLASHQATGNQQDTSTFVQGIFNNIADYSGDKTLDSGNTDFETEEIYFDTCGLETLEITQAFVVDDNAIDAGIQTASSSYSGYITDLNGLPVEGAVVSADSGAVTSKSDHNGFYHFYLYPGESNPINPDVLVERDCGAFSSISTPTMTAAHGSAAIQDVNITNEPYRDGLFAIVKATAEDCDGNGIAGLVVSLSGSKSKVTGADGIAEFKIRNYQDRDRIVRAVLLNNGGCFEVDCSGNCSSCMPTTTSGTPACYQTKPEILLTAFVMNSDAVLASSRGLKAGGRYPFGFVVRWDCGKISAVNPIKYIDIPRTQEKNTETFCSFAFNGNGIRVPGAKCLDIVRGENINPFLLRWVIDQIERTDDGKIKLTIQSLNDYNEKYFFKTNTIYQPLKGDRIEFIKNGDGKIFSISQYGLLNYLILSPFNDEQISGETDSPADFFNQLIITDDGRLDTLKVGAVIELQRIKECTTEPAYFGICVSIPFNDDGTLLYETGTFTTFDTFFVNRKIGSLPLQRFEHFSPSDFWGDSINRISDTGRAYFINKYENEKRFGRHITINSPNVYNRFGDIVKRFDPSIHGDIIAIWIVDNKIGFCLSEFDNTLFEIGDDLLRVGNDLIVRAATSDQLISDAQPKLRGTYGCQYDSIGSILFGDGWVLWVDVNRNCYVKHDYQVAKSVDMGKCQRYFRKRCQEIETFNRANADPLNQYRFATGMNWQSGAVHLTIKAFRHSGVNNEQAPFLKPNETIMFEPDSEDFLGFASFTPEAFSRLDLFNGSGCSFITYLNGIPYIHPIIPDKWNEFYSIAVDWYAGISINKGEDKLRRPLAMEIQSDTMFFAKEVTTDRPTYRSEIPPIKVKRNGKPDKWDASFLGNINSRGGLFGDEKPSGFWCQVLFCRDNTDGLKYNTIDNAKRTAYSELDLIFSKFAVVEQSGFQVNV